MQFNDFAAFGLSDALRHALTTCKFSAPTPIQAQAIPALMAGRDLLGIAQTGSGKTAAFCLPILQRLETEPARLGAFMTRALILAPTRELALQIDETVRRLSAGQRLRSVVIMGGASRFKQASAMRRGADIVIGTPGRVCDLLATRELNLSGVAAFVLDEADRMLDLGFIKDIRRIVAALPQTRQSALFSATMPDTVQGLAAGLLRNPVQVEIERAPELTPKIEQRLYHLPTSGKPGLLRDMLDDPALSRVIVFTRTKHGANRVAEVLHMNGVQVDALHGNKSQSQRERALGAFRSGRARVLVATDIAARGIDVTGVTHVINFDMPVDAESYVHRIGRTARAGASGVAISFCDPAERPALRAIERLTKEKIPVVGEEPSDDHRSRKPAAVVRPFSKRRPRGGRPPMRRAA